MISVPFGWKDRKGRFFAFLCGVQIFSFSACASLAAAVAVQQVVMPKGAE